MEDDAKENHEKKMAVTCHHIWMIFYMYVKGLSEKGASRSLLIIPHWYHSNLFIRHNQIRNNQLVLDPFLSSK